LRKQIKPSNFIQKPDIHQKFHTGNPKQFNSGKWKSIPDDRRTAKTERSRKQEAGE
jgi:hypothetical protein